MPNLTDLSYIRALCEKYGIRPSKGFGQNFLVNPGVCPKLCEAAGIDRDTCVLEIGPGIGTLTRELALRAKRVLSVEIDKGLLPVLHETLAGLDNVQIVQGDILKTDAPALLREVFGEGPAVLCANLPYNITSPVLMKLLEGRVPLENLTVMVQREAAQRLTAETGTREAGAVSYAVRYYTQPRFCFSVKPGSFYPPPKVTSAVIRLDVRKQTALPAGSSAEKQLFSLIRAGFSKRRKTLANAAGEEMGLSKEAITGALRRCGLPENARPEALTLEDYLRLLKTLYPTEVD
ncbi:16S rRNA (adenine(1518)-N(6)/adenine(1519)-N(6))-dimethyltransferase RsmA [Ruminococcaceae bacterium OttesenSCG-928-I18]|nr:16S rRNA (adenine(1518)-N(6)/adenine(1519)-N(6))-dimethyltransferase RsmA [Ruminococcaceae bacterium OttesenSCG-928-I18]